MAQLIWEGSISAFWCLKSELFLQCILTLSIQRCQGDLYLEGDVLWKQYSEIQGDEQLGAKSRTPPLPSSEISALAPELVIHSHMQSFMTSPKCLPTDVYRFWFSAGSPHSSVCDITACFHTNEWWGHTFRPPGLKAPRSELLSARGNRAEKYLALLRDKGEERMSWARAHMCLNRKCLMFHRHGEECFSSRKAQPRLDELFQLSLQNKSPALPEKAMCSGRRDSETRHFS